MSEHTPQFSLWLYIDYWDKREQTMTDCHYDKKTHIDCILQAYIYDKICSFNLSIDNFIAYKKTANI
jgi:hypothetical protein